ncbi:TPA: hypothetical protein HA239_03990 [Candidatus Woesearchaeota archaeon]|nr:hypothetical protein QT06_C0001G0784 [archaeon GW2011_AR15]MBS3103436.1 hypothetical protein [Candidatus Woesearchaeota archaeon]HIH41553.1 hypothetical protein [Candidatus Woesearchaeota archaeon]
MQSIFSYDLHSNIVSPDRRYVEREKYLPIIKNLLENHANTKAIERALREAHEHPHSGYAEFEAFRPEEKKKEKMELFIKLNSEKNYKELDFHIYKDIILSYLNKSPESRWVQAFKRIFGEDAVIASKDRNINTDAELMGHRPVELNQDIADYLVSKGLLSADNIKSTMEYRWIPDEELTEYERQVVALVPHIVQELTGGKKEVETRVYAGLFNQAGREIGGSEGVQTFDLLNGKKFIGVKRSILSEPYEFVKTSIHEFGHYETGTRDYSREFTDFFVKILGGKVFTSLQSSNLIPVQQSAQEGMIRDCNHS